MPIGRPQVQANGVKHCPEVAEPYLTKDDFELLYDKTGDILHARNPFREESPTVNIKYSVKDWAARIRVLLGLHIMHLVDDKKWIVEVPEEGQISLWAAQPFQAAQVGRSPNSVTITIRERVLRERQLLSDAGSPPASTNWYCV